MRVESIGRSWTRYDLRLYDPAVVDIGSVSEMAVGTSGVDGFRYSLFESVAFSYFEADACFEVVRDV